MIINKQPLIKWSGSKRHLAEEIIAFFPKNIETYYEPFLGGGSIFLRLIQKKEYKIENFILTDYNLDLINLWNMILTDPLKIFENYEKLHKKFNSKDIEYRKDYFKNIKIEFNKTKKSELFYFIIRTCFNGLIRYNKKGEFNSSCHFSRHGIQPFKVKDNLIFFNELMKNKNIKIKHSNYLDINSLNKKDILFLDPPYENTSGMYNPNSINYNEYFNWIKIQKGKIFFTFDGKQNNKIIKNSVPKELFSKHYYLSSKNSYSNESLYLKI